MPVRISIVALITAALAAAAAFGQDADDPLPTEVMREFSEAYSIIRNNYVDDIAAADLMRNAIRGLVQGLDPHSTYLHGDDLESFNSSIEGRYGGVGLYIGPGQGAIRVIAPIDDSPAAAAGMLAGDFIVAIDAASTSEMNVGEASNLMRGIVGTMVTLDVMRAVGSAVEQLQFELERARINAPSVRSAAAGEGFGYVRINQFLRASRTASELAEHIDRLYEENDGRLDGLVLDLRSNPGGDLSTSICVSSMFLPRDLLIVADRGRTHDNKHPSDLSRCPAPRYIDRVRKVNMVVLTDRGTASASEIVAGAMQDHDRAAIIGETTFGKASVQKIIYLRTTDESSALKLTAARYYTPSGRSIEGTGITPDIEIARQQLSQEQIEKAREEATPALGESSGTPFLPDAQNDPVFKRALEELRTMKLARNSDSGQAG